MGFGEVMTAQIEFLETRYMRSHLTCTFFSLRDLIFLRVLCVRLLENK